MSKSVDTKPRAQRIDSQDEAVASSAESADSAESEASDASAPSEAARSWDATGAATLESVFVWERSAASVSPCIS